MVDVSKIVWCTSTTRKVLQNNCKQRSGLKYYASGAEKATDRRLATHVAAMLGGTAISYFCKTQTVVAVSTSSRTLSAVPVASNGKAATSLCLQVPSHLCAVYCDEGAAGVPHVLDEPRANRSTPCVGRVCPAGRTLPRNHGEVESRLGSRCTVFICLARPPGSSERQVFFKGISPTGLPPPSFSFFCWKSFGVLTTTTQRLLASEKNQGRGSCG